MEVLDQCKYFVAFHPYHILQPPNNFVTGQEGGRAPWYQAGSYPGGYLENVNDLAIGSSKWHRRGVCQDVKVVLAAETKKSIAYVVYLNTKHFAYISFKQLLSLLLIRSFYLC